jgi:hypothetical protein
MDEGKLKIKFLSNPTNFKFSVDLNHIYYLTTSIVSKHWSGNPKQFHGNQGMVYHFCIKEERSGFLFPHVQIFKILNWMTRTLNYLFSGLHFCLL